ncbi:right-handed parallel beta-helix repeat-containing protein [Acidocella sp.]|uniref:right-handed parallel beta-helix repeat-containing protein n=1 Tax=Acidocella sp. TaxID=50710 RepID=UPI00260C291A|nr:right-handed parallel beta-helix repeat-containing protein [Acidocella sp.]
MPTIGQLPLAGSVSDGAEIAVYQNGQTLAATRAQFLAGMQTALAVPQNTVLGGVAAGTAAPAPIAIGANLVLSGSTLSATAAPFVVSALPAGVVPGAADIVPLGQGGANAGVSYAGFLAGLGGVAGVPGGNLVATATGALTARTLAHLAANAVSIEDFGAAGDGVTDDSAALLAAIGSGAPVRLGAKTYAIAGECDIAGANCVILGVPGLSVLQRPAQSKAGTSTPGAWISVSSANFHADGVIFDANSAVAGDYMAVAIQAGCAKSLITRCVFKNAQGATHGHGLTFLASDPAVTAHHVDDCEFSANAAHGIYAYAVDALSITNCRAHDNGVNGIYVDSFDPTFVLKVRALHVVANSCWNNSVGILVGNFVANNVSTTPLLYGNANPDILGAVVAANNCFSNREYGIYVSGRNILVSGNLCTNNSTTAVFGAGILCDTGYCKVTGNMVAGATPFGIDCGGSIYTEVDNNYINGAAVGLNIGGGQYCLARSNFIQDCTGVAVNAENVEASGAGDNFGLACTGLSIVGNWINYSGGAMGIVVRDGAQNILIKDNIIEAQPGAPQANALSAYTDTVTLRGNLVNYTSRVKVSPAMVNGLYTLTVPDLADAVAVTQASAPVASIMTAAAVQAAGQVTFIKVTVQGLGYTTATVTISGTGSGAAATPWISGGKIIGIQMTSFGAGYGAITTVTITGDGGGAAAVAQVGVPVWQNRELAIDCLVATEFAAGGSSPPQSNWTGAPITVPAGASIDWIGNAGGWRAARFTQGDYVSPNGDGSVTITTQAGDVSLKPMGGGAVRLKSATEATGAAELIGRGSPLNAVSAPAGSTYRNLNGGVGASFWVAQAAGSANWVAVA